MKFTKPNPNASYSDLSAAASLASPSADEVITVDASPAPSPPSEPAAVQQLTEEGQTGPGKRKRVTLYAVFTPKDKVVDLTGDADSGDADSRKVPAAGDGPVASIFFSRVRGAPPSGAGAGAGASPPLAVLPVPASGAGAGASPPLAELPVPASGAGTGASPPLTLSVSIVHSGGAGAGAGAGANLPITFSYLDPPNVRLTKLSTSVAHQLFALSWPPAAVNKLVAGLGVLHKPPPTSLDDKNLALKNLLKNLSEHLFYKDKRVFAALTAGLRNFGEFDFTPLLLCLKEPTAVGIGVAPTMAADGVTRNQTTYTLAQLLERVKAAAAAKGLPMPPLQPVNEDDWAAPPLGSTGDTIRAALLSLGPYGDSIGYGNIFVHVVPHSENKIQPKFPSDVHAPPEGAFSAALVMIKSYVETMGVRGAVAMGEPSWKAWRGVLEREAHLAGERSAVLRNLIETPLGSGEVEYTVSNLDSGVVVAAHTGHAVTFADKNTPSSSSPPSTSP